MGGRVRHIIVFGQRTSAFAKLGGLVVTVEGQRVAEERFTLGRRMTAFLAWRSNGGTL